MTQMFRPSSDAFVCPACDEDMQLTAVIPPVGGSYGLRVYVCPCCDRSKDMLVPAQSARR